MYMVQKRLETNIKYRKSSRLTVFDRNRNISKCESPKAPALSDAQQKALHRKQQLKKWKEEKDKKKKEAAAQKKKPFVVGMSPRKTFGPPPPLPKPTPSTTGRVTRSQARLKLEPEPSYTQTESFAPRNATFEPSLFLNTEVPKLAPVNKKKASKSQPSMIFEPVLPKKIQKETRTTTRTPPPLKQKMFQSSSSSSDTEQPKLRKKPVLLKSVPPQPSTSQDSACVLLDSSISSSDTASMSSKQHNSQDTASISSQDACNSQDITSTSPDTASMSSHDELSTLRNKVPKSESGSEEKLRSPKLLDLKLTPQQIIEEVKNMSPCVTTSRGKDNARKEMRKKLDEGLLGEDNGDMDSVNYFRRQLQSEIARITAMCDTWDQIFAQTVLPEPIQELVLTAVGQARLLMSQKLQQFAGLVERCAKPTPGTALVTPADLHGFWDMVFMQVENVDMRFKYLEELRLRDWIEAAKPSAKKVVAKRLAKKAVVKASGGPSRLKEMIAAARKTKKDQESQSENSKSEKSEPVSSPETKTFEAGFFRVSSPLKHGSPALATPNNKSSLLKTVLSSDAKKSISKKKSKLSYIQNSSTFTMLRALLMSKTMDIDGVSPLPQSPTITPGNLYGTPARSIFKPNNPISTKKTEKPKTVLFHESEEPSSPTSCTSCERMESRVAPLSVEDKENEDTPKMKEATPRKTRLVRKNAEEHRSPMMTRSRRKRAQTPLVEADANLEGGRRSARKPQDTETPKRSSKRRKSAAADV